MVKSASDVLFVGQSQTHKRLSVSWNAQRQRLHCPSAENGEILVKPPLQLVKPASWLVLVQYANGEYDLTGKPNMF